MSIPTFTFKTDDDVKRYFEFLIEEELTYHLDDEPKDIRWYLDIGYEDIKQLQKNHRALWDYCDPWLFMEQFPDYWDRYCNE